MAEIEAYTWVFLVWCHRNMADVLFIYNLAARFFKYEENTLLWGKSGYLIFVPALKYIL